MSDESDDSWKYVVQIYFINNLTRFWIHSIQMGTLTSCVDHELIESSKIPWNQLIGFQ